MTKDEFCALPIKTALGLLWDYCRLDEELAAMPAPTPPPPPRSSASAPRYDRRIPRKDGVTYASEYDLEGLRYWHGRASAGAVVSGPYQEADRKQAEALAYWITYREAEPAAVWTGLRGDDVVTAAAPSNKPTVYPRDARPAPAGGGFV